MRNLMLVMFAILMMGQTSLAFGQAPLAPPVPAVAPVAVAPVAVVPVTTPTLPVEGTAVVAPPEVVAPVVAIPEPVKVVVPVEAVIPPIPATVEDSWLNIKSGVMMLLCGLVGLLIGLLKKKGVVIPVETPVAEVKTEEKK